MLHNPNATRNIAKWAVELPEFELDFVVDWTLRPCLLGGPDINKPEVKALIFTEPHWTLFFDGS
jgi:hypothetical protein